MLLYHFTSREHYTTRIDPAGYLALTESNVGSPDPRWEPYGTHQGPPVVWLLDTPVLGHLHGLRTFTPRELQERIDRGMFPPGTRQPDKTELRITVEVEDAVRWAEWDPQTWMNYRWRNKFVTGAGGPKAAASWWVSERPIPRAEWAAVDEVESSQRRLTPKKKRRK